jgi:hypothetical protein
MTHPDVGQNLRQCLESGYVHDIIPIESCKRATLFELRPPLHRKRAGLTDRDVQTSSKS